MRAGSTADFSPRPPHSGQAPWGLLKEKRRGSSGVLPGDVALAHDQGVVSVEQVDEHGALAELQGQLDGIGEAALDVVPDHDAIDDHVEIVGDLRIDPEILPEIDVLAVDARADVSLPTQPAQLLGEISALATRHTRQQDGPGALTAGDDAIDDLLDRISLQHLPRDGAVGHPHASEQKAQVVGDLRDGPHRRARALAEGALLDRDGRTEPVDALDGRLGQLIQELPRVGGEGLHIAALAFGIDGVEGERRLAGPARSRDDHEPIAGQLAGDVLQVVLRRTRDDQALHGAADISQLAGRFLVLRA